MGHKSVGVGWPVDKPQMEFGHGDKVEGCQDSAQIEQPLGGLSGLVSLGKTVVPDDAVHHQRQLAQWREQNRGDHFGWIVVHDVARMIHSKDLENNRSGWIWNSVQATLFGDDCTDEHHEDEGNECGEAE